MPKKLNKIVEPKEYTVLLRRPDYVTTDQKDQLYLTYVVADSPPQAVRFATAEAVDADGGDDPSQTDDYAVLFLCERHVADLSSEVCR